MTAEEYWNSEGIRFLNEDGTLPTVEDRVKEGYVRGWENGWDVAWNTRDEMDKHRCNPEAGFLRQEVKFLKAEIERLREEANNWHQHYRDERRKAKSWKEWGFKQQDEVTRFRDALELIANATGGDDARYYQDIAQTALSEVALITAQNDPLTEEPVSLDPAPKFTHEGNTDVKVKQPEWRELGPDEVICDGDEVQPNKTKGEWKKAWSFELGVKAGHFKAMRFRTRRPLPKQERTLPRLDAEIEVIGTPSTYSATEARYATADAIRFLRDEIQKIKEAK